eukprot:TRINITY_DN1164_c2_g1_i3.p1 TRINITY_DN1164_c2_g1~~TRINITY_DN1164_c2_g1_i3.p1  ORF type:complete len:642 (+),score=204.98 TRINITY_DN1164_c2_g1_i3:65-1927(+)
MYIMKRVDLALLGEEDQKRAVQECKLLIALRHPNIVKYRESISTPRCQYTVMEYCKGGSLEQLIAARRKLGSGPFEESRVLRWIAQLATALDYCHKAHVLHRDIKAANCFLSSDHNDILLGDFGIAKVLSHTMAVAQTIIGSPCNMSPEVIEGKAYNQASDVWSLGCLLFEMCALRKPFTSHNLNQLVQQVTVEKTPPAPKHTSPMVQDLLKTLLEKDPAKRATLHDVLAHPAIQSALVSSTTPTHKAARTTGPDNSHLSMEDWLRQHNASLDKIRAYLNSMKKPDEQYVRSQMNEVKPKTPDLRVDRVSSNNKLSSPRHASPPSSAPSKKKPRLQPLPEAPLNPKQAREQREAELEMKRAKIAQERDARRLRDKQLEEQNEQLRKQNAEDRKTAANQRHEILGKPQPVAKARERNAGQQPPPLTQQQKEQAALEEKKRRIMQEREEKREKQQLANEKAEEVRRQFAEDRKKAVEARRLQQGAKRERPSLANTWKGAAVQFVEENYGRAREGYNGGGDRESKGSRDSSEKTTDSSNAMEKKDGRDTPKSGARMRAKSEPSRAPNPSVADDAIADRREQRRQAQDELRQRIAADRQRAMKSNKANQPGHEIEICVPAHLFK